MGALEDKSFQFIRYSYNDPVYSQYKNATDFLVKELTQNGIIDDNQVRLKTILVSTNLSLFGNAAFAGESTWKFLNQPQPWGVAPAAWLEASLKSFGYPAEYAKKLIALAPLIIHDQGDLFLILYQRRWWMMSDICHSVRVYRLIQILKNGLAVPHCNWGNWAR